MFTILLFIDMSSKGNWKHKLQNGHTLEKYAATGKQWETYFYTIIKWSSEKIYIMKKEQGSEKCAQYSTIYLRKR